MLLKVEPKTAEYTELESYLNNSRGSTHHLRYRVSFALKFQEESRNTDLKRWRISSELNEKEKMSDSKKHTAISRIAIGVFYSTD